MSENEIQYTAGPRIETWNNGPASVFHEFNHDFFSGLPNPRKTQLKKRKAIGKPLEIYSYHSFKAYGSTLPERQESQS